MLTPLAPIRVLAAPPDPASPFPYDRYALVLLDLPIVGAPHARRQWTTPLGWS